MPCHALSCQHRTSESRATWIQSYLYRPITDLWDCLFQHKRRGKKKTNRTHLLRLLAQTSENRPPQHPADNTCINNILTLREPAIPNQVSDGVCVFFNALTVVRGRTIALRRFLVLQPYGITNSQINVPKISI